MFYDFEVINVEKEDVKQVIYVCLKNNSINSHFESLILKMRLKILIFSPMNN